MMDRISLRRLSASEFRRELAAYVEALRLEIEDGVRGFAVDPEAAKQRTARARQDLRFFGQTYLPHYHTIPSESRAHVWIYEHLPPRIDRPGGSKTALAAPRGEGKSTLLGLELILWCLATRRKHYILIVSDTHRQAATLLAAIKAELASNPRLRSDFPDMAGEGRLWREDEIVSDNRKVQALGSGQRMRGLRHGPHRVDLVIGDDLENDENVATPEQRRKMANWWSQVVRFAGPPDGSLDVVAIGTRIHHDSLLTHLLDSPLWGGKTFRAIMRWPDRMDLWDEFTSLATAEGEDAARRYYRRHQGKMDRGAEVCWPRAQPLVELMLERAENPVSFATEKQNDPSAGPEAIFADCLHYWQDRPAGLITFGAVDPSLGRAGAGRDPSAILVGGLARSGKGRRSLYVLEALIRRRPPGAIIADVIELQRRYNCSVWAIENVQFQEYFRQELVTQSSEAGMPVPAIGVTPHIDKRLRIESLEPHISNGLILVGREQRTLIDQLEHFPHAAHDDGPDALHMLWTLAVSRSGAGIEGIRSRPRPDRVPIHWEQY